MKTTTSAQSTQEVAARFNELAKQEKWFEIQDELFADRVRSVEPVSSRYFNNAEGKAAVRKKGEEFTSRIEGVTRLYTSEPIVTENHFAVTRETDISVKGLGRVQINQIMLYEVRDGKIVLEQFFY